jgi:hypothetical protein
LYGVMPPTQNLLEAFRSPALVPEPGRAFMTSLSEVRREE